MQAEAVEDIANIQDKLDEKRLPEICKEILEKRDPCGPFDYSGMPAPVRNYIDLIIKRGHVESIMVMQSFLCALSAIFKTRFFIPKGTYYQTLFPVLWMLSISPSGTFKTTGLNNGAQLATERQRDIYRRVDEAKKALKTLESDSATAEKARDKTAIKKEIEAAKKNIKEIESQGVIVPSRGSVQGLVDHLANTGGGMVVCSELAQWMGNAGREINQDMKPLLTDMFDCPEYLPPEALRSRDGVETVRRPFLSINAVSTLPWVQKYFATTDVETGFFARFLLFYPPQGRRRTPAFPPFADPDKSAENEVRRIIEKTLSRGEVAFSVSAKARKFVEGVRGGYFDQIEAHSDKAKDLLHPMLNRWTPYILKIGMLLQPFIDDGNEISLEAVKAAHSVVEYAIKSTVFLFENDLGESEQQRKQRKIMEYMARKDGTVKRNKLIESKILDGGSLEYDYIINTLIDMNKVTVKNKDKKTACTYSLIST